MRLFACKLWLWLCDLSFIRSLLSKMVKAVDQGKEEMRFGMLWLVSYCFLLRLPSEVGRGLCYLLGMLVCVLMSARRCLYANASQTRRSLRHPSPLFGGKATRFACACCAGKTDNQVVVSSFALNATRSVLFALAQVAAS